MGYAHTFAPILFEYPFNMTSSMWVIDSTIGDVGPFTYTIPATLPKNEILHAYLDLYLSNINNTFAGANYMEVTSYIKCRKNGVGTYANAIYIPGNSFDVGSQGIFNGGRIYGNLDIVDEIELGQDLQIIWYQADTHQDNFQLEGLKYFILRLYLG